MSDRVLVMWEGQIAKEFKRGEDTEEDVMLTLLANIRMPHDQFQHRRTAERRNEPERFAELAIRRN